MKHTSLAANNRAANTAASRSAWLAFVIIRDGNDKYTTEVVLQGYNGNLTLLDSRNSQGGGGGYGQSGGGYNQDSGGGNVTQGRSQSASMQEGPAESFDLDDEIPF